MHQRHFATAIIKLFFQNDNKEELSESGANYFISFLRTGDCPEEPVRGEQHQRLLCR